jgi:hypothetical protein
MRRLAKSCGQQATAKGIEFEIMFVGCGQLIFCISFLKLFSLLTIQFFFASYLLEVLLLAGVGMRGLGKKNLLKFNFFIVVRILPVVGYFLKAASRLNERGHWRQVGSFS